MIDIFSDYVLQREELLARIAQELQLNKSRIEKMESAYNAVSKVLQKDEDFFDGLIIEIYAQGSKRIETTVKPINDEDFDLDTVLHIYDPYYNHSPEKIYNALVNALEKGGYGEIMEKKSRCIRLNYKGDFHMDILPACMPDAYDKELIKIPEKILTSWSSGNPKGFAKWFLDIAKSVRESLLSKYSDVLIKAQVETEPLPPELYEKTPLQRAVQLIKRYRDIYFRNRNYSVSSIVITTLSAQFYDGESSIFESIDQIVLRIRNGYDTAIISGTRFKVLNPINQEEDFTDSWTDKHYEAFYGFIVDFHKKWQKLKETFEYSKNDYIELFGEGIYKKSLNDQMAYFSKSTDDKLVQSSSLITGDMAFTDSKGHINKAHGIKNKAHHSFGGRC